MADISPTAANVAASTNAAKTTVIAGATITAGMPVYKDANDSDKYKAAINDDSTKAVARGVSLNGASDGQPLEIITSGEYNPGAAVTLGEIYCVSGTAGGLCPVGDIVSGDYMTIIGVAKDTETVNVHIQVSNALTPAE